MANINIRFDASMNVSQVKSSVKELQNAFNGLKIPQGLSNDINETISKLNKEITNFEAKSSKNLTSMKDVNDITKSYDKILGYFERLKTLTKNIKSKNATDLFPDSALNNIKKANTALKEYYDSAKKIEDEIKKQNSELKKQEDKYKELAGKKEALESQNKSLSSSKGANTKQITAKENERDKLIAQQSTLKKSSEQYKQLEERIKTLRSEIKSLESQNSKINSTLTTNRATIKGLESQITSADTVINNLKQSITELNNQSQQNAIDILRQKIAEIRNIDISQIPNSLSEIENIIKGMNSEELAKVEQELNRIDLSTDKAADGFTELGEKVGNLDDQAQSINKTASELESLNNRVQAFFGISNSIYIFQRLLRNAFETVSDLDKAMTETAVVTDFSVGDMWEALPRYTESANKLGTTTLGAYQTMTLFYQQGLKTNEVFEIGTETMKMARIAGMDYTKATDLMTAALRGFNMELNEVSAQRINDVYSELAAITAADTEEIADAMTRTASIANSAGMEFETTSAFLSQMIETTREAPENLGTAMKTIVARFQELKKAPSEIASEIDGEAIDVNKIDTALKSIGVSLMDNVTGQFRDLDDVFLEIASKWQSLDKNTQRYIATIAAGSRQQSRFIAMMSDYDRTMELVDAANNSAGASQRQFEKTTESLESKINKLKNAWNEFAMGIVNDQLIKFSIDTLTSLLTILNKITNTSNKGVNSILKLTMAIMGLKAGKTVLSSLIKFVGKQWIGVKQNTDEIRSLGDAFTLLKTKGDKGKKGIEGVSKTFKDFYADLVKGIVVKDIDFNTIGTSLASQLDDIDSKKIQDLANQYQASTTQVIAFNKARLSGVPVEKAAILLRDEEAARQLLNARLTDEETRAIVEETVARQGNLKTIELSNGARAAEYVKLLFSKKATRAVAAENLGLATKTGEATVATTKLGAALMALPIGWVVAGIAAIVAGFAILAKIKYENSLKGQLENVQKTLEKTQESLADAKTALEDLTSSKDKFEEVESSFNGLVEGTDAWNEKLLESNNLISELISKYPELRVIDNNGRLTIDEDSFDEAIKKQNEIITTWSSVNTTLSAKQNTLQAKSDYEALGKKLTGQSTTEVADAFVKALQDNPNLFKYGAEALRTAADEYTSADLSGLSDSIVNSIYESKDDLISAYNKISTAQIQEQQAIQVAIKNGLSGNEDINKNQLDTATFILSTNYDKIYKAQKDKIEEGLDGANETEAREWANAKGFKYVNQDFFDKDVNYIDTSGNAQKISNEIVSEELAELKAQNEIQERAKELINTLDNVNKGFADSLSQYSENVSSTLISDILSKSDTINSEVINTLSENEDAILASANSYFSGLSDEETARTLSSLLGEEYDTVYADIDTYKTELVDLLNKNVKDIQSAQVKRNLEITSTIAKSLKLDEDTLNDKLYYSINEFISSLDESQKNIFNTLASSIEENLGSNASDAFVKSILDSFYDGGAEDTQDVLNSLNEIDFSDPISSFEKLNKNIQSTNEYVAKASKEILSMGKNAYSTSSQIKYFYTKMSESEDIQKEISDLIEENGRITSQDLKDIASQGGQLQKVLDNTGLSTTALAKAFTKLEKGEIVLNDLTDSGLKLLSSMEQLNTVVEDVYDIVDNFEPDRDLGEVADYFNEITDTAIEMYQGGEYGNDQMISYIKLLFGEDAWSQALADADGNLEDAEKKFIDKINILKNNIYGAWRDLALNYQDEISDFNNKTNNDFGINLGADKSINLKINGMTTNEIVAAVSEIYGVSDEYAKALIADFKNYSGEFATVVNYNDAVSGLVDYINGNTFENFDKTVFSSENIKSTANLLGISEDEYLVMLGRMYDSTVKTADDAKKAFQKNKIGYIDIFDKDIDKDYNEILNNIIEATGNTDLSSLSKQFITQDKFIIDDFQETMSKLNVPDGVVNKMISDIAGTIGDTPMTINGVEVNKEELAKEGVDVSQFLTSTVESANWEKVGQSILDGIVNGVKSNWEKLKKSIYNPIKKGVDNAVSYGKLNLPKIVANELIQYIWVKFIKKNDPSDLVKGKDTTTPIRRIPSKRELFNEYQQRKLEEAAESQIDYSSPVVSGYNNKKAQTYGKNSDDDDNDSNDTIKVTEYADALDKLYNTYQRINKELRLINKYQERYDRLLDTANVTGKDLANNLEKQKKYYELLIDRNKTVKDTRNNQIESILNQKAKYKHTDEDGNESWKYSKSAISKYFNYNKEYGLLTVKDISKYNSLRKTNSELYEHLEDIRSKLEGYQSDIEEANDNLEDATNALEDMLKEGREQYRDLEDRVYEAIIYREQEKIDSLDRINNSINDANKDLIDSIQNNLDKIRQDRQNQETEKDIAGKERRLAYLRRDTSNANALEIKKLEEELANQKEDYTDTLIDQKISELQEQNNEAAEQRQQQIDLLQAQLDSDEKRGEFWEEAHTLLKDGIDKTGKLVQTSQLVELLKSAEGFAGMSQVEQMDWFQDLGKTAAKGWLWLQNFMNTAFGANTLYYQWETGQVSTGDKITANNKTDNKTVNGTVNNKGNLTTTPSKGGQYFEYSGDKLYQDEDGNWITEERLRSARRFKPRTKIKVRAAKNGKIVLVSTTANEQGILVADNDPNKAYTDLNVTTNSPDKYQHYYTNAARRIQEATAGNTLKFAAYKTGGLADFTGPAWLDGTKTKPELILNQRDTENFIQLKDILRSLLNNNQFNNSGNGGDNIYEIHIEVDKLENDYDVEQVANKVKRMIVNDSQYRNVNAINRLR